MAIFIPSGSKHMFGHDKFHGDAKHTEDSAIHMSDDDQEADSPMVTSFSNTGNNNNGQLRNTKPLSGSLGAGFRADARQNIQASSDGQPKASQTREETQPRFEVVDVLESDGWDREEESRRDKYLGKQSDVPHQVCELTTEI